MSLLLCGICADIWTWLEDEQGTIWDQPRHGWLGLVDINNIHGGASKACEWDLMAREAGLESQPGYVWGFEQLNYASLEPICF